MTTLAELEARLRSKVTLDDAELDEWVRVSDTTLARVFFAGGSDAADYAAASRVAAHLVDAYLNNPHTSEVPLRRKSRVCLVLNNLALHAPVRPAVFQAIGNLTSIFERGINEEGAMQFDPELGRLSEHVLVLLMRLTNYQLQASAVYEFAEQNTQFAVQLLLAILLKEPPYEFDLRCNCIDGLLGLTQPQAFFQSSSSSGSGGSSSNNNGAGASAIQEHTCAMFTDKINYILQLMLRLQAVQVVSDVLCDAMDGNTLAPVPAPVAHAFVNTMRTILNLFKFCSIDAVKWRQHLLLSTTFVDGAVVQFVQCQLAGLKDALRAAPASPPSSSSLSSLLSELNLAFRLGAFATYHLGDAAVAMRLYCTFFHDALQLSLRGVVTDARLSGQCMVLYVNLLHWMCNVDALAGDAALPAADLLPELRSASLQQSLTHFLSSEVAVHGAAMVQAWQRQFRRGDQDTLLARDSVTYELMDALFTSLLDRSATTTTVASGAAAAVTSMPTKATSAATTTTAAGAHASAAAPPPPPASPPPRRLLGELPSLKKPAVEAKMSVEHAADRITLPQRIAPPRGSGSSHMNASSSSSAAAADASLLCALTHNTMKQPVSSPYGHTFEKEAILSWLQQNGSVCPITGKRLTEGDLRPNTAVATRIMQQMVLQSMQAQPDQDDSDMYRF